MKLLKAKVNSISRVTSNVYRIGISSPLLARKSLPGQFLHIKLEDKRVLLRRPFSIHRVDRTVVYILFKRRGVATDILSNLKKGASLDVLGPLGNGFSYFGDTAWRKSIKENIMLVAGGIGVAPLVFLAQKINALRGTDYKPPILTFLGARAKSEVLCEGDFKRLGSKVRVATDDGSMGFKGTATDLLKNQLRTKICQLKAYVYACGPQDMLRSLSAVLKKFPGLVCEASFEQFMGCGIGVCYGCVIESKAGYKKVCKDGPVFNLRDIY